MDYLHGYSTKVTPQSEKAPGTTQVANSAGGFGWTVDPFDRLLRFLILGSEGGSYYASERELTIENATCVADCINIDPERTVRTIVEVSVAGRAPKNDPAIFALALCASATSDDARKLALGSVSAVCRTGTHLFTFASLMRNHRGWGRGMRTAIGEWYGGDVDRLAYQMVKYRNRAGYTHRDMLRLAHPKPRTEFHNSLYKWATGKPHNGVPEIVGAFEAAQASPDAKTTIKLIAAHPDLPREALNPEHLNDPGVWMALLEAGMPMTAMIRNLATMTRAGALAPMSEAAGIITTQLGDGEWLRKSRVHPLAVLVAMKTYAQGHGHRSGTTWDPVTSVIDALDSAFYECFDNVQPTGKRTVLALDISGSMGWPDIANMPGITPAVGSAAMALVTMAVEKQTLVVGFSTTLIPLPISPKQRLDDVVRSLSGIAMGGTDCSLPITEALRHRLPVDTFIVYTDSETWAGNIHPHQALEMYRREMGIDAKLVVVGMVSNGFTIANPNDPGMLDVVGFDTATPQVISQFSTM